MTEQPDYTPGTIRTYSGRYIDPLDPEPGEISILDIAHALSLQCRYNGHIDTFYSVAEHSLAVLERVRWLHPLPYYDLHLAALLHDAAEAYLGDMVRPVKQRMVFFAEADDYLTKAIFERFGLDPSPRHREIIDDADRFVYDAERALITTNTRTPTKPFDVEGRFMGEFRDLYELIRYRD